jgi:lysophospholipase L1-like esterase
VILIPICFFLLLELTLSVFSLYDEHPLFLSDNAEGKNLYRVNPYVAERYFPPTSPTLPTLYPQPFEKEKSAGTIRIFCLGGSTTEGFPFDEQVPFPQQLKFMLQESLPDRNIEVINLGISAVNSYTVADLLPEVIQMQPDAIIIYMGHNEFYGVFGSASGLSNINNHYLVKTYLLLRKFRTVRMLQRWLRGITPANDESASKTLMAAAARPEPIAIDSKLYRQTLENFTANLSDIEALCRKHRIPLILGTLISNERDLPPFQSNLVATKNLLNEDIRQFISNEPTISNVEKLQKSLAKFSSDDIAKNAVLSYLHGQAALVQGDTSLARSLLIRARDLDGIRFRAASELNEVIRRFATKHNILLADVETNFRAHSPGGIIGASLVCDHLHPNPDGYFLMAKSYFETLANVVTEAKQSKVLEHTNPYFVTELDWEIGLLKIHNMTRRWPFAEKPTGYENYQPYSNKAIADIAYSYIYQHHQWARAQFEAADYWLKQNQPTKSIAVLRAVMAMYPDNTLPVTKIAQIYMNYSNWSSAIKYLQHALQLKSNLGMAHMMLAECYRQINKIDEAIQEMQLALKAPDLLTTERRFGAFRMAEWLSQINRTKEAEAMLRDLIKRYPDFKEANTMLENLSK